MNCLQFHYMYLFKYMYFDDEFIVFISFGCYNAVSYTHLQNKIKTIANKMKIYLTAYCDGILPIRYILVKFLSSLDSVAFTNFYFGLVLRDCLWWFPFIQSDNWTSVHCSLMRLTQRVSVMLVRIECRRNNEWNAHTRDKQNVCVLRHFY